MRVGEAMKYSRFVIALAMLVSIWPSGTEAQPTSKREVFVFSRSTTDKPSAASKVTSDVALAAQTVTTKAAGWMLKYHPCFKVMTDTIVQAGVETQKQRELLGGGSTSDLLAEVAMAGRARYLVVFDVTNIGEKWSFNGQVVDRDAGRILASHQASAIGLEAASREASTFGQDVVTTAGFPDCEERWSGTITVELAFDKTDNSLLTLPDGTGSVKKTNRQKWDFHGTIDLYAGRNPSPISYTYTSTYSRDIQAEIKKPGCSGHSHDWGTTTDNASGDRTTSVALTREGAARRGPASPNRVPVTGAGVPPEIDHLRIVLIGIEGMGGAQHEVSSSESSASGPDCGGSGSQTQSWDRAGINRVSFDVDYPIPVPKDADRVFHSWSDKPSGIKRTFTVDLKRSWK